MSSGARNWWMHCVQQWRPMPVFSLSTWIKFRSTNLDLKSCKHTIWCELAHVARTSWRSRLRDRSWKKRSDCWQQQMRTTKRRANMSSCIRRRRRHQPLRRRGRQQPNASDSCVQMNGSLCFKLSSLCFKVVVMSAGLCA